MTKDERDILIRYANRLLDDVEAIMVMWKLQLDRRGEGLGA